MKTRKEWDDEARRSELAHRMVSAIVRGLETGDDFLAQCWQHLSEQDQITYRSEWLRVACEETDDG